VLSRQIKICAIASFCTIIIFSVTFFTTQRAFAGTGIGQIRLSAWLTTASVAGQIEGVSCFEQSQCVAVGQSNDLSSAAIYYSENAGINWQVTYAPKGINNLTAVDCPAQNFCLATGTYYSGFGAAIIETNGSFLTWKISAQLGGGALNTISCINSSQCLAAGEVGSNIIYETNDSGNSWLPVNLNLEASGAVNSISCTSGGYCAAGGYEVANNESVGNLKGFIYVSSSDFQNSQEVTLPSQIVDITSVSCPSNSLCMTAGVAMNSQPTIGTISGEQASLFTPPTSFHVGYLSSAYCTNSSLCFISGAYQNSTSLVISTDNFGQSYSQDFLPLNSAAIPELGGIYCFNSFCLVDGSTQSGLSTQFFVTESADSLKSPPALASNLASLITPPTGPYPNILITGDSMSYDLWLGLLSYENAYGLNILNDPLIGCSVMQYPMIYHGSLQPVFPGCLNSYQEISAAIDEDDPKAVLIEFGRWETPNKIIGSQNLFLGNPVLDADETNALIRFQNICSFNGANTAFLSSPYFLSGLSVIDSPWPEDNPERVNVYNDLIQNVGNFTDSPIFNLNALISSPNSFLRVSDGIPVRQTDGIHFTLPGAIYIANKIYVFLDLLALKPSTGTKNTRSFYGLIRII
jgi:hypothetical protein